MMRRLTLALALFGLAAAPTAIAQTPVWRTVDVQRQRGATDTLRVNVEYGAGTLGLAAAPQPLLYDVKLRFDANQVLPRARFDSTTHTLRIRADSAGDHILTFGDHKGDGSDATPSDVHVGLARGIPLDLRLRVGAAKSDMDLSDLWIDRFSLETGASETDIVFGTPNPKPMRELTVKSGAAGVTLRQLGNARAISVNVTTGAGETTLDLSGAWTGESHVKVRVLLGHVTLRVPRDVGLRMNATATIANIDDAGLTRRGSALVSSNYDSAKRKLLLDVSATVGGVDIEWID